MNVFKKQISTWKMLLYLSVLLNIMLAGVVYVAEKKSHVFSMALARRNIITLSSRIYPDYWARVGWTNTIEKLHMDFDVAFFGNSITRGSDFQMFFPDKKIINLGYSGDNMVGMLRRVPMLQASHPKKIFIMAGTNDLVHISLEAYKERYVTLLDAIKNANPDAEIYIESVLPSNHKMGKYASNEKVQKANEIAKSIAGMYGCKYINLYDLYADNSNELPKELTLDGVHLYPQSYNKWAETIKPMIYE